MKIGVDLDEVLGQFLQALIEWHNATYKTNWKIEEFYTYHFWEIWGGTQEEAIQKRYDFQKTDHFKNIKPVPGAQEALEKLKVNNELYIITARQNDIVKETKEWIDRYFQNIFSEIYFGNQFAHSGNVRTKKEMCNEVGIEILIEDSLFHATECVTPKRKIFLINYPWNQSDILPKGVERVYSWKEITDAIEK